LVGCTDLNVYQAFFPVPAGGDAAVVVHRKGLIGAGSTYRLATYAQPTVHPDEATVTAHTPVPWRPVPGAADERGRKRHPAVEVGRNAMVEARYEGG